MAFETVEKRYRFREMNQYSYRQRDDDCGKYILIFFYCFCYHTTKIVVNYELPITKRECRSPIDRLLFLNVCGDVHTGPELWICLFNGSIYLERTIGFVHLLSDRNHCTMKSLCSHSVRTKLYRTADLYVYEIFFLSIQAKHRGTFIYEFAKCFARIDIFADIHCYIGCITADRSFDFQ